MLRVLPLVLRLLLERPQLLLRLPVVVVLQVARRLVQGAWVLVRLEGRPLALGSKSHLVVLDPLQSQCSHTVCSHHVIKSNRRHRPSWPTSLLHSRQQTS